MGFRRPYETYIIYLNDTHPSPPYLHSIWVFGLEEEHKILLSGDMQNIKTCN